MTELEGRRPLKTREAGLAQRGAKWLSQKNITPNQISIASIFFALIAGLCFLYTPYVSGSLQWLLPLLAAVFIQFRLLCNLFDGMVAIEGGKSTPAGELFNDIPDRIADSLILISAGYIVSATSWGETLGWCAGLLAIMTAYVRALGASLGAPVSFIGPMAKQHRMALMTAASVLTTIEVLFWHATPIAGHVMMVALILVILGSAITLARRTRNIYNHLENK